MAIITSTIGTATRNYSTIQAWEDGLPASAVTAGNSYVGECYNDSEFTAGVTFAGTTTDSTHTITLKCASGQSFRDNANKATNRLAYNQSNGVGINTNVAYSTVVTISENYVTVDGLQIKGQGLGTIAVGAGGSVTNTIVKNSIFDAVPSGSINDSAIQLNDSTCKIYNCLLILRGTGGNTGISLGNGSLAINCTIVRPSNFTAAGKPFVSPYGTATVKNCAIFGFSTASTGTFATDGHNGTDQTSAPGTTSNLTSLTYANQFQQSSTASSVEDFRLKSGAGLIDAGVTDSTDISSADDIIGTSRSTWDIGSWEYVASGTAVSDPPFIRPYLSFLVR